MSLAAVFGPLFFSTVYFAVKAQWPGAVWVIAAGVYLLVLPLFFAVRTDRNPAASKQDGQS